MLPGDYEISGADDIEDFLMRLKHSLGDSSELLANIVAFWLIGEYEANNWKTAGMRLPGVDSGMPTYPGNSPEIPATKYDAAKG